MSPNYLVEVVPPGGSRVFRLEISRRHLAALTLTATLLCAAAALFGIELWRHAAVRAGQARSSADHRRQELKTINARASALDIELHALQSQNDQIRRLIGERRPPGQDAAGHVPVLGPQSYDGEGESFARVSARIERLRGDSARARRDGRGLERVALRVLNMRRLEKIARSRVLAAIPSLNPAGAAKVASAFGWRSVPWPEYHEGVDLDANYADEVRASAAGTVVTAGYDGGYGIKVDIDHGNGYHTLYCHLSRADVSAGQYVHKAEHIALVGSTGASTGPHLHYQIMLDGHPVDPEPYLTGIPARVLASRR